jgi:hypothetical protein
MRHVKPADNDDRFDHEIDRVVVVCNRFWMDSLVGVFSLFNGIRMAFFEMTQVDEVARWMQNE